MTDQSTNNPWETSIRHRHDDSDRQMAESLVTKRLHISGLTPAITATDIQRRLSAFGTVKATDGFGACDALGDPRKFAFVTIEATPKDLAKCLNVLSGSTWKGTKLRIGEAKPDFRERIAHINSLPPPPLRQKHLCVRNHGHPSSTLPLTPLSPSAAAKTPGWTITLSGRVVRPMKMRPERPLEPMRATVSELKSKSVGKGVKKRIKPPPARARRRIIDPTKWDSTYLTGMFLDAIPVASSHTQEVASMAVDVIESESEEVEDENVDEIGMDVHDPSSLGQIPASIHPRAMAQPGGEVTHHEDPIAVDVRQETTTSLALLSSMFGESDEWGGSESADETQMDSSNRVGPDDQTAIVVDNEAEIEVVPRGYPLASGVSHKQTGGNVPTEVEKHPDELESGNINDAEMVGTHPSPIQGSTTSPSTSVPAPPVSTLKDLFAPREEESSFTLLGHLDLDLELEDVLPVAHPVPAPAPSHHVIRQSIPAVHVPTTTKHHRLHTVTLGSTQPLLFPLPESLPYPLSSLATNTHPRVPCILFPNPNSRSLQIKDVLPPSNAFTRSQDTTAESIREQWERDKVSLTHEWKKAWREARGSRRGRGGGGGGDE
ncbi:hypothetical protein J3A83DRAFT_4368607 [Scleroderma citrinum]